MSYIDLDAGSQTPYAGAERPGIPGADELRARIPGWGADLDPADRPAVPREIRSEYVRSSPPPDQPGAEGRERSIEHARVTPVFGTVAPLRGVSGRIRRVAYERYSEGRAAHWLLLLAADRVESKGSTVRSFVSRRPDDPITQTGVLAELRHHGLASRARHGRVDTVHHALDPVIVGLPWALSAWAGYRVVRRLARRR